MLDTLQSGSTLKSPYPTKNIFIVDDSQSVRVAMRLAIESCTNFHVCGEASHGAEAVSRAQPLRPDAVVMDLAMPEMNGIEAANLLKKRMPEVQIVLFTIYADEVNIPLSSAFGVTKVLSKSEGFEPLVKWLNGILG
jgi:DNA-binding NarL/FixJ family response regulator